MLSLFYYRISLSFLTTGIMFIQGFSWLCCGICWKKRSIRCSNLKDASCSGIVLLYFDWWKISNLFNTYSLNINFEDYLAFSWTKKSRVIPPLSRVLCSRNTIGKVIHQAIVMYIVQYFYLSKLSKSLHTLLYTFPTLLNTLKPLLHSFTLLNTLINYFCTLKHFINLFCTLKHSYKLFLYS